MDSLFTEQLLLDLPNCDIQYFPSFFVKKTSDYYFETFKREVPWQQDNITVFGKTHLQPRLTALYGNNDQSYTYANITMHPHPFTQNLQTIKSTIETKTNTIFTSCLCNLYRDGKDSNGWHADNEKELGIDPVIASISLGQERYFHLKHRTKKGIKQKILLGHGSLLLMQGETQHHWLHQIPKTARPIKERINLTFRVLR